MGRLNQVHHGDCIEVMRQMGVCSVDSIVTDPPYELGFMGKSWDATGIAYSVEMWSEALRVLKPGGHLLAFSGSRTYHRMVCAIEDAGFEIRDQIMWVYGSGFPKSLDVSKAIDKAAGVERDVVGYRKPGGSGVAGDANPDATGSHIWTGELRSTEAVSDAAIQWQGWGTALKPAHEPIVVARKPLVGTVAANVLAHGTGALNIDACRVPTDDNLNGGAYAAERQHSDSPWAASGSLHQTTGETFMQPTGRWPANLIHDGSDEVLVAFPQAPGQQQQAKANGEATTNVFAPRERVGGPAPRGDTGSAARFFYCAKASKADRDEGLDDAPDQVLAMSNQAKAELARGNMHAGDSGMNSAKVRKNHHPTVKPTALMQYLCRLVTPPGGTVLDPFMGSGSTGKAALREGFNFIGIERDSEYIEIAMARVCAARRQGHQPSLDLEVA